jgi:hypothetical protein
MKYKNRRKLVTEETVINIDEEVFQLKAEELYTEMFVDYVNKILGRVVLELKGKKL